MAEEVLTNKEQEIANWKAKAYDCLANIEALQRQLQQINQEIARLSQPEPVVPEEK